MFFSVSVLIVFIHALFFMVLFLSLLCCLDVTQPNTCTAPFILFVFLFADWLAQMRKISLTLLVIVHLIHFSLSLPSLSLSLSLTHTQTHNAEQCAFTKDGVYCTLCYSIDIFCTKVVSAKEKQIKDSKIINAKVLWYSCKWI